MGGQSSDDLGGVRRPEALGQRWSHFAPEMVSFPESDQSTQKNGGGLGGPELRESVFGAPVRQDVFRRPPCAHQGTSEHPAAYSTSVSQPPSHAGDIYCSA